MDNTVERDINLTSKVLKGEIDSEYHKIYFETNEPVNNILDSFDIKDKTILTVLGSGDQAFHFYNRGAKRVDLFDINRLTIHYYYLRRWTIIYLGKSYPPYNFDSDFLLKLLTSVKPKNDSELKSFNYWRKFANLLNTLNTESKFLFHYSLEKRNETVFDGTHLEQIINKDSFNFYNINIARLVKILHKYDIIYTSNVADYVNMSGSFNSYRINLKRLLKKDGVIISSRVGDFSFPDPDGMNTLKKNFVYHNLLKTCYLEDSETYDYGYYYTKKKLRNYFSDKNY